MNPQEVINAFFTQDGQIEPNGVIRKSVILSLKRDLSFCILLPRVWTSPSSVVHLSETQFSAIQQILPTFTVISQFCSGIDVLARVVNKAQPLGGQNGQYFRDCAEQWFGFSAIEASELWNLRNGISHSYRLVTGQQAEQYGHNKAIRQSANGQWVFYLHAMYTTLDNSIKSIYTHLSSEGLQDKEVTARYLDDNGFYYTRG